MTRPSFAVAWAASSKIYNAANPGAKVAEVIGGAVAKNINMPAPLRLEKYLCCSHELHS